MPANIVNSLATDDLLAVIITAIIVGYLIEDPRSPIIRITEEIERMITKIITFLIHVAPIGVFFLILPNLMKLDIAQIGTNLGLLIGGVLSTMVIHMLIVIPILFFFLTRLNPYAYWIKVRSTPKLLTSLGEVCNNELTF